MKTIFSLIFILLLLSCQETQKQPETTDIFDDENQENIEESKEVKEITSIEDIQQEYQNITHHKNLDSISFQYNCYEKSGKLTYFKDKENLQLIKHSYNDASHFSSTEYFYIKDNELFFAFYDEVAWVFDPESTEPGNTRDNITEKRYYFIGGELIKCLEKKFVIRSALEDNLTSVDVPNREKDCPKDQVILQHFQTLLKHQSQEENLRCLE